MPWFEEQMEAWGEIVSAGLLQEALLHKSEPFTLIFHINYTVREHKPIQQQEKKNFFRSFSEVI